MMDRESMLRTIDATYEARQKGEKDGVAAFLAPGATYRLIGTPHLLGGMSVGPDDARAAIGALIDRFEFTSVRRAAELVDGNRAAVIMEVSVATGDGTVATEVFDIWTFNEAGQVTEIVQSADTAQIAALLAARGEG